MIAEKGLVWEERDVSPPQSEHKELWSCGLNLGEEVPVIIHRDNIISDHERIIDHGAHIRAEVRRLRRPRQCPKLGKPGNPPPPTPDPGLVSPTRNHRYRYGLRYSLQDPQISEDPHLECWGCSLLPGTQESQTGLQTLLRPQA